MVEVNEIVAKVDLGKQSLLGSQGGDVGGRRSLWQEKEELFLHLSAVLLGPRTCHHGGRDDRGGHERRRSYG